MSKKQTKFGFLKSLKDSFLNTENIEKSEPSFDDDNVLREIGIKTVNPNIIDKENLSFQGASSASEIDIRFAENFVESGGKFIFAESISEVFNFLDSLKTKNKWNHIFASTNEMSNLLMQNNFQTDKLGFFLDNSDAAISFCYRLSANEGVIILSPEDASNRRNVSFPENHIIIAYKEQLKHNIEDAIEGFKEKFESRLPSVLELYDTKPVARSNHKTLLSADGPKNVFLFYIDSEIE